MSEVLIKNCFLFKKLKSWWFVVCHGARDQTDVYSANILSAYLPYVRERYCTLYA